MPEISSYETSEKLKERISINLKGLSEQSKRYIEDIMVLVNKEIGINKILSIILFGSQRSENIKESTMISDCDLLFIFKNRVSNRHIKEIEKHFIALEIKHKFKEYDSTLINHILGVIQQSTGMFVSHFLTKQRYWEQGIFHKIFQVNKVFSSLFAPRYIVLANLIENSTILYGKDLRNQIKPHLKYSIKEMFKSTVMNLFISFFSLIITPLKKLNSIKYQLEAIKWSLRTSNFYCFSDAEDLQTIINRFISFDNTIAQNKAKRFFNNFIQLRKNPKTSLKFILRCPIRIIKIHVKAIIYKKFVKSKFKIPSKPGEKVITSRSFPYH